MQERIKAFVKESLLSNTNCKKIELGILSKSEVAILATKIHVSMSGSFKRIIRENDVRHSFDRHNDIYEHFDKIAVVLKEYDTVEKSIVQGRTRIVYEKTIDGILFRYVEAINFKQKELMLKTFFMPKADPDIA